MNHYTSDEVRYIHLYLMHKQNLYVFTVYGAQKHSAIASIIKVTVDHNN